MHVHVIIHVCIYDIHVFKRFTYYIYCVCVCTQGHAHVCVCVCTCTSTPRYTTGGHQWGTPMGDTTGGHQWGTPMGDTNGGHRWGTPMGDTNLAHTPSQRRQYCMCQHYIITHTHTHTRQTDRENRYMYVGYAIYVMLLTFKLLLSAFLLCTN